MGYDGAPSLEWRPRKSCPQRHFRGGGRPPRGSLNARADAVVEQAGLTAEHRVEPVFSGRRMGCLSPMRHCPALAPGRGQRGAHAEPACACCERRSRWPPAFRLTACESSSPPRRICALSAFLPTLTTGRRREAPPQLHGADSGRCMLGKRLATTTEATSAGRRLPFFLAARAGRRLTDSLISSNGIISDKLAGKIRYMDSL